MFSTQSVLRTSLIAALAALMICLPTMTLAQQPLESIGSVNVVGRVELRGVAVDGLGTVFPGDEIRTDSQGYAQISLSQGAQIELGGNTQARMNSRDAGVHVDLESGSLALASPRSSGSLNVSANTWEIETSDGAAANVALLEGDELGVRALNGRVTVKSARSSETLVVEAGDARIVSLSDPIGSVAGPTGPEPLPAPRRQLLDREWVAVGITAGVIGAAIGTWLLLRDASPDTP